MAMIADALALYEFLQKNKDKYTTLSALFSSEGKRMKGSNKLEIEIIKSNKTNTWFYKVKPIKDYVFTPIPVTACYIDYGKVVGSENSDSKIFRFVDNSMAHFTSGGVSNLLVNFSIIGYKPEQLLDRLEK